MLNVFGDRQQELLRSLHRNKKGLTIDELAAALKVTRTAVKQHLVTLEQGGYVDRGVLKLTRGRPGRAYLLSPRGVDLFPKQYSWFSGLLLRGVKVERGSEGLAQHLRDMAKSIAAALKDRTEGKTGSERLAEIVKLMNELSYEAELHQASEGEPLGIRASNCVYHHLAQEFPEVCQFDLELLARLSGAGVDHQECIIRGGNACRFAFREPKVKETES
jgi:predicted ArsR family transcriptional regulator